MSKIKAILEATDHRPWELPTEEWKYYQEWNNAIFFHWEVPLEILRPLVPEGLTIDTYNDTAWVSLVAFTMEKIRPKNLPAFAPISNFHEINLRTYVSHNGKQGVYFLNIEAEKQLSAFIAKKISGLPYEKATIQRTSTSYHSVNEAKDFHLNTRFKVNKVITEKSDLDLWLTERYCLFLDEKNKLFRYDIHHKEWVIKNIGIKEFNLNYKIRDLILDNETVDLIHYSDGVEVVAWEKEEVLID